MFEPFASCDATGHLDNCKEKKTCWLPSSTVAPYLPQSSMFDLSDCLRCHAGTHNLADILSIVKVDH
jgi:hypothetical protein